MDNSVGSKRRRIEEGGLQCEHITSHTIFGLACLQNNLPRVKLMLEHGADINEMDAGGWSPMMLAAAANGNGEVAMHLISMGADSSLTRNGDTAVSIALGEENLELADRMQAAILGRCAWNPDSMEVY